MYKENLQRLLKYLILHTSKCIYGILKNLLFKKLQLYVYIGIGESDKINKIHFVKTD